MFHVKQQLRSWDGLFHVKQLGSKWIKNCLFADAEIPENHVQDVLDVDPADQPPERVSRQPQFLGDQFLARACTSDRAAQGDVRRLLQQLPLPLPA